MKKRNSCVFLISKLTIILLVASALTVYFPIALNFPINVLLPVAIAWYFRPQFFVSLKMITLALGKLLLVLVMLHQLEVNFYLWLVVWILRINILEAVLEDFKKKHFLNAIAGLTLIVNTFLFTATWHDFYYLMNGPLFVLWIFNYTLWNYNFILNNFSNKESFYHISVLSVPLIFNVIMQNAGFWLIMRTSSLTLAVTIQAIAEKKPILDELENKRYDAMVSKLKKEAIQILITTFIIISSSIVAITQF